MEAGSVTLKNAITNDLIYSYTDEDFDPTLFTRIGNFKITRNIIYG